MDWEKLYPNLSFPVENKIGTPFFEKQSIFDPRPENCLSIS